MQQLDKSVALQCGLAGLFTAELAGESAKKGASIQQVNNNPISFSTFKIIFERKDLSNFQMQQMKRISNKKWKDLDPDRIPDWSRHVAVTHFRIFIDHDCLAPYLHRFKWLLIHTVPSIDANLLWMATTFSVVAFPWPKLGSKVSNEEISVLFLRSFLLCLLFYCHTPLQL